MTLEGYREEIYVETSAQGQALPVCSAPEVDLGDRVGRILKQAAKAATPQPGL